MFKIDFLLLHYITNVNNIRINKNGGSNLIPTSSLLKDIYFPGFESPECLQSYPNSVFDATYNIGILNPGDQVSIELDVYYCCSQADDGIANTSGYSIFNEFKSLNSWHIDISAKDECNDIINIGTNNTSNYFKTGPYLATDAGLVAEHLYLDQRYIPSNDEFHAPCSLATCCSPNKILDISNIEFNLDPSSASGFKLNTSYIFSTSCSTSTPDLMPADAIVRFIFELGPGLYLDHSGIPAPSCPNSYITFRNATGAIWNCSQFYPPDEHCDPSQVSTYKIDFNANDLPTNSIQDFYEFLNNSSLEFSLKGCCCNLSNTNPTYKIKTYIAGKDGSCFIPMSEIEGEAHIHCPGCTWPGMSVNAGGTTVLDRTTFGYEDTQDDGKKDNNIIIQGPYLVSHPGVAKNRSIVGDELITILQSTITPGNTGQHMSDVLSTFGVDISHLYAEIVIPYSNCSAFNVSIQKIDIDLQRGGTTYTVNNITPSHSAWATLVHDRRDISFGVGFEDHYFLDLSPNVLGLLGLPNNHLQENDAFTIKLYYKVLSNYNPNTSVLVADNEFLSRVQLNMYLTEFDLANNGVFDAMRNPPNPNPYLMAQQEFNLGNTPTSPCKWLWVCETEGGNHYFTSIKPQLRTWLYEGTSAKCTKSLGIESRVLMGGESKNIFPFEYRVPPGIIKYNINLPGSYSDYVPDPATTLFSTVRTYDDLNICYPEFTHSAISNSAISLTPDPLNNRWTLSYVMPTLDQSISYQTAPPCTTSINGINGMLTSDERFIHNLVFPFDWRECNSSIINLSPQCVQMELNLNSTIPPNCSTLVNINVNSDVQGGNSTLTPSYPDGFRLIPFNPVHINSTVTPVPITFYNDGLNQHDAEHAFIYIPTNSDLTYELYNGGVLISPNATTQVNGVNVVYWELGTVLYNSTIPTEFSLHISFTNGCPTILNYNIIVNYGWNCYEYPSDLELTNGQFCYKNDETLAVDLTTFGPVNVVNPPKSPYNICETETVNVTFTNSGTPVSNFHIILSCSDPIFQSYILPASFLITSTDPLNIISTVVTQSVNSYTLDVTFSNGFISSGESINLFYQYLPLNVFTPFPIQITFEYDEYCGTTHQYGPVTMEFENAGNVCNLNVDITAQPANVVCAGEPVLLTAITSGTNAGLTTSYAWEANGAPVGTNNYQFNIPNATVTTTYTVTATNTVGDIATNTCTVQVVNGLCCLDGYNQLWDYSFYNETTTALIQQIGYNYLTTGNKIYINGILTVDQDFTFEACGNIILGPGASINVLSGFVLNVNDCHISSCDELARGIIAEPNSNVSLYSSVIEDCLYGVEARNNSAIYSENCNFKNNYVGIYYSPELSHSVPPFMVYGEVNGTIFTSTTQLKNPYQGLTTTVLDKPFSGILASEMASLSIGNLTKQENEFELSNFGILITNSNLMVQNCSFKQILNYDQYPAMYNTLGSGIFFDGSGGTYRLTVSGRNDLVQPEFTNCLKGISTYVGSVNASFNSFVNCDEGFRLTNNRYQDISITSNNIDFNQFGIVSLYNDAVSINEYNDNILVGGNRTHKLDGFLCTPHGIVIYDINGGLNGGSIMRNQITITPHNTTISRAISLQSAGSYHINDNSITLNYSSPTRIMGIGLQNSDGNFLECNHIYGSRVGLATNNDPDIAMRFDRSSNFISCNDVTNTSTGFLFSDFCDNLSFRTVLRTNDIGNHFNGLRYTTSATVAPQLSTGNNWSLPVYPGWGAVNDDFLGVSSEQFEIDGNNPVNQFGQFNLPNPNTPNWFNGINTSDETCDDNGLHHGLCGSVDPGGSHSSQIFYRLIQIALDSINSAEFNEETKWKAKLDLYEILLNMPEYLDSSQVLADFYASYSGSVIQQIAELNLENENLFNIQQALLNLMSSNAEAIYYYSESIRNCDKELERSTLTDGERDSITNYKLSLVQNIKSLISFNNSGFHVIDSTLEVSVDLLNSQNQDSGIEIYEENNHLINEIYYASVAEGEVQPLLNYAGTLLNVASQCPIAGGPAVYRARSLYFYIDPEMEYNDDQLCLQQGYVYRKSPHTKFASKIFPNPATNEITIIHNMLDDKGIIQIYDQLGRIVIKHNLESSVVSTTLDVSKLENGIYNYTLFNKDGAILDINQFVISK